MGVVAVAGGPVGGGPFMVTPLLALENLLVFSFGALFPLPFMETDGTTLLRHRHALRRRTVIVQE